MVKKILIGVLLFWCGLVTAGLVVAFFDSNNSPVSEDDNINNNNINNNNINNNNINNKYSILEDGHYKVKRVIDGDTIVVYRNDVGSETARVRILGYDARELSQCGGEMAKSTLKDIINEKGKGMILLKREQTEPNKDVYDRYLRKAYVNNSKVMLGVAFVECIYVTNQCMEDPITNYKVAENMCISLITKEVKSYE